MTKKILAVAMAALLMLSALSMSAFATEAVAAETTAAPEEVVKDEVLDYIDADAAAAAEAAMAPVNDSIYYISFGGNNENDGLTADTPKKQLLTPEDAGVVSLLYPAAGNLVAVGKLYAGGSYSFPAFEGTLKITSNDGTTDFKNPEPATNPACAFKIKDNCTVTFQSDVIIEDIILFNEHDNKTTTLAITNNSTLVIEENIVSMNNAANENYAVPCYMSLYVEDGSTLIVKGGTFDRISGGGNVYIADSVVLEEKVVEIKTDENGMIIPDIVVTRPPVATEEPDAAETTAAVTGDAEVKTDDANVDNQADGGFPVVPVVIAVIAVVVVAVVVVVATKKKK